MEMDEPIIYNKNIIEMIFSYENPLQRFFSEEFI